MKKWLIIGGSILLLIFLAVNGIRMQINQASSAREQYVADLNFNFTGQIDSIRLLNQKRGVVAFHIIRGDFDKNREAELNKKLKANRSIEFITIKDNGVLKIVTQLGSACKPGDSIQVDTSQNKFRIFHEGKMVGESEVVSTLRGRNL